MVSWENSRENETERGCSAGDGGCHDHSTHQGLLETVRSLKCRPCAENVTDPCSSVLYDEHAIVDPFIPDETSPSDLPIALVTVNAADNAVKALQDKMVKLISRMEGASLELCIKETELLVWEERLLHLPWENELKLRRVNFQAIDEGEESAAPNLEDGKALENKPSGGSMARCAGWSAESSDINALDAAGQQLAACQGVNALVAHFLSELGMLKKNWQDMEHAESLQGSNGAELSVPSSDQKLLAISQSSLPHECSVESMEQFLDSEHASRARRAKQRVHAHRDETLRALQRTQLKTAQARDTTQEYVKFQQRLEGYQLAKRRHVQARAAALEQVVEIEALRVQLANERARSRRRFRDQQARVFFHVEVESPGEMQATVRNLFQEQFLRESLVRDHDTLLEHILKAEQEQLDVHAQREAAWHMLHQQHIKWVESEGGDQEEELAYLQLLDYEQMAVEEITNEKISVLGKLSQVERALAEILAERERAQREIEDQRAKLDYADEKTQGDISSVVDRLESELQARTAGTHEREASLQQTSRLERERLDHLEQKLPNKQATVAQAEEDHRPPCAWQSAKHLRRLFFFVEESSPSEMQAMIRRLCEEHFSEEPEKQVDDRAPEHASQAQQLEQRSEAPHVLHPYRTALAPEFQANREDLRACNRAERLLANQLSEGEKLEDQLDLPKGRRVVMI